MCRTPWCDRPADATDTGGRRFCSDRCHVEYDHIREDARQAQMVDEREAHEADRRGF